MSDISTKALQDIPPKHRGIEGIAPVAGASANKTIKKAQQTIDASSASGSKSDNSRKENSSPSTFTVMITNKSGEIRAMSLSAGSADEAKSAATSGLSQGEQVSSVSASTVQQPNPDRGLLA